jgi:hypothetical protein
MLESSHAIYGINKYTQTLPLQIYIACVAGGIRGHERMGSLKYRLPKNDTF